MSAEVKALLRAMEKEAEEMANDFGIRFQKIRSHRELEEAIASLASKQAALCAIVRKAIEGTEE